MFATVIASLRSCGIRSERKGLIGSSLVFVGSTESCRCWTRSLIRRNGIFTCSGHVVDVMSWLKMEMKSLSTLKELIHGVCKRTIDLA